MPANSRSRLREFQLRLTERLEKAMASPVTASKLGFLINDTHWLVDLVEAGEIFPLQEVVTVPHTQDWYRGLTNVRGALLSVVDLSLFLGGAPTRIDHNSRVLAFAPALEFNAGIIVTRTLGLYDTASWRLVDSQWIDDQDQVWVSVSLRALAMEERFLQISRVGNWSVSGAS